MAGRSACLAVAAMLLAGSVCADTITRTVKANQRTAVAGVFTYQLETCEAAEIPNLSFRTQPSHATVAITPVTVSVGPGNSCTGKKITGPALIYTPSKGFKGQDEFTIEYTFATNEVDRRRFSPGPS